MRTLFGIVLGVIAATSADAALQPSSATLEKPALIAASQRSVSDFTSCQLLQEPVSVTACSAQDAVIVASAPPRRPPRRTRRR